MQAGIKLPHFPFANLIDWSVPIPSIFDRQKPLVHNTERRLAIGVKRFVIEAEKPYLIDLNTGTRDWNSDSHSEFSGMRPMYRFNAQPSFPPLIRNRLRAVMTLPIRRQPLPPA